MTPELLTSILGVVFSLCASYLPGFSAWYQTLDTTLKRLVMGLGLLLHCRRHLRNRLRWIRCADRRHPVL